MSIIYDALKKVDKTLKKPDQFCAETKTQVKSKAPYLIYVLTAVIAIFIANAVFGLVNKPKPDIINQQKSAIALVSSKPEPVAVSESSLIAEPKNIIQEDVALNGVFFEQGNGYALINNKIVKVGDVIAGATVKSIDLDGVELVGAAGSFKLNNPQKD